MKLKFYCDAGHGWLAVKRELLIKLNILNEISEYSYQRGNTVYLEEDMDAGTLLEALNDSHIDHEIISPNTWPDRSVIRSYECFSK